MKGALAKRMEAFANDFRTTLRDKRIQYAGVTREGRHGERSLPRQGDARQGAIASSNARSRISSCARRTTRANRASSRPCRPEAQTRTQDFALQQNITTLRNRVNELGVAEPIIQQQGADRVVVQLPGVQDTAKAKDILGRTATLEVRLVDEEKIGSGHAPGGGRRTGAFRHGILRRAQRRTRDRQAAGGAHGRPHQRCAAGFRQHHERAGGAHHARCDGRAHFPAGHARERRQAHGDPALRERQGGSRHRACDPPGDRRRPGADQRPHDHARSERRRAAVARGRARRADGHHRGAHRRTVARSGEHQARFPVDVVRIRGDRDSS